MNLPRLAVDRPVTIGMLLVSTVVLGGIALVRLPRAYLPEVDVPFILVQVPYPSSSPTQVEKEITKPMEEVLSILPGVKKLNSESHADGADLFLEFQWGEELDLVRMQVSEKVEQIKPELPAGVGEILILSFNTTDIPVVQARISAKSVDLSANYELLETRVANRIRRVAGVARVTLEGVAPKEIDIDLLLDKIKEHRVDIGALVRNLQGFASNVVLGSVEDGGLRFTARALTGFRSIDEISQVLVNDHGLRLADIAEITYREPRIEYGRHLDGQYAIALEVYKESTANTVDVVRQVMDLLRGEVSQDPLLQGVELFVWEDQAEEITSSLRGLLNAGAIGALLAIVVLYAFLRRLDSTLIVAASIPFSLVAACGALYFMGKNLNVLSMMGLMLGVGMLVDNAVVVLESIDRLHRTEPDPKEAARSGGRMVATAVAASTLTTLIVFLPLIVGARTELTTWLKEVGIPISISMACSLFSSLTLIPLTSAHVLRRKQTQPVAAIVRLEDLYAKALAWTLRHWGKSVALFACCLALGIVPFIAGMVESAIFSGTVNKRVALRYEFADFTYKSQAEQAVNRVEETLAANRDELLVDSVYSYYTENEAQTAIVLRRQDLTDEEVKKLRARIREKLPVIPGVRLLFEDDDAESGGDTTFFEVKLYGQDTGVLERYAGEASRRIETVAGTQDVTTSLKDARREVWVRVDREKALRRGLAAQDVADIFSFTLGGMRLARFNAGEREVDTWLALRLEDRENLDDLRRLAVRADSGQEVLLGDIATFEIVPRAARIRRENRKVRVSVSATYEGEEWDAAKKEIEGLMNAFELPPGYSWSWDDRILEQEGQSQQMTINFVLALILVYLVMASLFESLAQPFAILFSIPFALPGAAWMLAATGTKFNLMAQIGLLMLMGIVVNNGIVLVDHANQLRRRGRTREQAIIEAGRDRLRPILMTAATTVIGLLPLAIRGSQVGGLFYYPLARTVMGGLLSSSILTLLFLPVITLGIEGFAGWLRHLWRASTPRRPAAASPAAAGEQL